MAVEIVFVVFLFLYLVSRFPTRTESNAECSFYFCQWGHRYQVESILVTEHRELSFYLVLPSFCWGVFCGDRYDYQASYRACFVDWTSSLSYSTLLVVVTFFLPLISMLVCYHAILQVARTKCKRINFGEHQLSLPPHSHTDDCNVALCRFPFRPGRDDVAVVRVTVCICKRKLQSSFFSSSIDSCVLNHVPKSAFECT